MFDIYNKEGSMIGSVNQDELYKLMNKGIIKSDDKIYDSYTGQRVDNR